MARSKEIHSSQITRRMRKAEVREFLEERWERYERPGFVEDDPIAIPQQFALKEDKEISGFITATIAWGNRKSIMTNAHSVVQRMDGAPYAFVTGASDHELRSLEGFVHRTFNDTDLLVFVSALRHLYLYRDGLEGVFTSAFRQEGNAAGAIARFREVFFEIEHPDRTGKHVANPMKGSSAKRINMFLRWMVRSAERGVDFGLWTGIDTAFLEVPLDVHTGNVARQLGLLTRKQNDRKAVEELMKHLRRFDANDPAKYDFALFGAGVYEGIGSP